MCATGLPGGASDFVSGEDAWFYVEDKSQLIAEAVRIVKPGFRPAGARGRGGRDGLLQQLGHAGKVAQGRFIARRT